MNRTFSIVGLGEVLWDCLPDGKRLGGAPANFAYVCGRLGDRGIIASRVGDDPDGREIRQNLQSAGVDLSHVQQDDRHATGTVRVELNNGQPAYEITENVAWDYLEMTPDWRTLAQSCDAVCFGSLAQRRPVSRKTIREFVGQTRPEALRIFDVNLRQDYFSAAVVRESLTQANVVKLNHEELPVLAELLALRNSGEIERVRELREIFDLRLVCLTRGGRGSLLAAEDEIDEHAGFNIRIADTIGAGDSFAAALAHGLLRGRSLAEINQKASGIAAFVASQSGAMPEFPAEFTL